jgi:5-methylcytosine-specific restriction endonuclease McrA
VNEHGTEGNSTEEADAKAAPELTPAEEDQAEVAMPIAYLCPRCGAMGGKQGRCPTCKRERERARGSAYRRGYDKAHQRLRRLAIAQHPYCTDCGTNADLCADHVVPLSRGGTNTLSNYAVRCRRCNSSKGSPVFSEQATADPAPRSISAESDGR